MIIATILSPGVATIVYPLSIFGFAMMEEKKPSKGFWYFIIFYTELLIGIEFILSLDFW